MVNTPKGQITHQNLWFMVLLAHFKSPAEKVKRDWDTKSCSKICIVDQGKTFRTRIFFISPLWLNSVTLSVAHIAFSQSQPKAAREKCKKMCAFTVIQHTQLSFLENQTLAQASWPVVLSPWPLSMTSSIVFLIPLMRVLETCVRCQIEYLFFKDFKNHI